MDDPKLNKNLAVSNGPVNRRLMAPPVPPRQSAVPVVHKRLEATRAKLRLGASLAERLSPLQHHSNNAEPLSSWEIVAVVGAAVSAVGLTLGLIQSAFLVIGTSALFLCGFGTAAYLGTRSRRHAGGAETADAGNLIDDKDIALLDTAMETLATTAPQETIDRLSDLKAQISRSLALIASTKSNPACLDEDQFFIRECVRRYLPDSISGFLRVPQRDRGTLLIDDGKTALNLLHDQFEMLQNQLQAKENRLTQLAGESLMQQQRFLAVKTGTRK